MRPLNELEWDEDGGYWYDDIFGEGGGNDITPKEMLEYAADLEERLAEYENDETARRRVDAFKIRQLKADILVLERKYRDVKQGR